MKTLVTIFILLITAILLILAIPSFTDKDATTTPTASTAQDNAIHLRFGHNTPVDSALHEASLKFANEVKRKTNGKVLIDIFPAQKLGNDHQMVEMARDGQLDIILTPTAKMSVAVPSMQYADLPFYFPTREDVYEMLDGEPGQMILNDLQSIGLIGVTFWENGFKHFTANKPLLSLEDFKDTKMRVMKSRIIMEQFHSFGAESVLIDFHSTKKALHDKVVDGQENPLVAIVSMGFYKEQSDLTLSEHAYLGYVLSFSEKTFSKLPQNIQLLLIETAKEITPFEREATHKRETKLIEIIKESGVNVHTISDEERHRFAKATAYIPQKYEELIGPNIISKTKELLYKKYGANLNHEDHILIGINADISSDSKVAGLSIKRGAELAIAEINAQGGVLGKPLELIVKDHRAIASHGVKNIEEFDEYKNLAAVIGGVHSPVISAELETIQKLKVPYLLPWSAAAGLVQNGYQNNYVFRLSANDTQAACFIAHFAIKKHHHPAIIVENSIWGRENLKLMKEHLEKHRSKDAIELIFNRGQASFSEEITKIIHSQADSIIMVANPIEGSKIIRELYKNKKSLPVISHWGITSGAFFKENKDILKEMDLSIFQTFSFNNKLNKKGQQLLKSYQERYLLDKDENIRASAGAAQAYDLVQLLALAIKKAGSIDREKIKNALENLPNYEGVVKNYKPAFSANNHEALNSEDYYMAKYNLNGILIPIKN